MSQRELFDGARAKESRDTVLAEYATRVGDV